MEDITLKCKIISMWALLVAIGAFLGFILAPFIFLIALVAFFVFRSMAALLIGIGVLFAFVLAPFIFLIALVVFFVSLLVYFFLCFLSFIFRLIGLKSEKIVAIKE